MIISILREPMITLFNLYMNSFIAKRVNSILVNLRYLRFKLLKYKENNKKICNTFDHNFKNIPLYIMRKVSLEMYYFVLYNGALTLKMSKMALNPSCDKTLHMIINTYIWLLPYFDKTMQVTNHPNICFLDWTLSRNTYPAERYSSQDIMILYWCQCKWQTHFC